MNQFLRGLLDLIFPTNCYACGDSVGKPLCDRCISSFSLVREPLCLKCGKPCFLEVNRCRVCSGRKFYFAKARAFGLYEGNLKRAIHQFKYENGQRLAPVLASLMAERVEPALFEVDFVTWVPISARKEAKRGFNQAHLLAREISKNCNKQYLPTLKLCKETADQSKLTLSERKINVKNAFRAAPGKNLQGKEVLLIDDVFTTGSTINECSKTLIKTGLKKVHVLTIARAILQ